MNYEKFYLIGFWIATLYAFVMLPYNLERMQRMDTIETKTTTNTELLETEETWKENLSETLQILWTLIPQASANVQTSDAVKSAKDSTTGHIRTPKQIYEQVKHLWFREAPTVSLISNCKASSRDPRHCILVGLTLMYNEAGNKQNSKACITRNNCFWVNSWKKVYSSLDEWSENWVQKYNRYWYKADWASFFYSSSGKVSKSRYCTSEISSNSSVWCPSGLKIATDKWSKLYPIIY